MKEELEKLRRLIRQVRNPVPALLDHFGLCSAPYRLTTRDGTTIEIRPRTGDLFGFYEIVLRGDYFLSGQRLAVGQTVVDVGANIGCFTVSAAKMVGPSGHVFAIEPERSTFRQLQRNVECNKLKNVTALQMAVGAAEGEIILHAHPNRLFSSIYEEVNGQTISIGTEQRVPVTTLAALMDRYQIWRCHYLKLDCEGAEHDIVDSMHPAMVARIDGITMEVHKVPGRDGDVLRQRLAALGLSRIGSATLPFYVHAAGCEPQ
jgi:FkbM family methyltransferase